MYNTVTITAVSYVTMHINVIIALLTMYTALSYVIQLTIYVYESMYTN